MVNSYKLESLLFHIILLKVIWTSLLVSTLCAKQTRRAGSFVGSPQLLTQETNSCTHCKSHAFNQSKIVHLKEGLFSVYEETRAKVGVRGKQKPAHLPAWCPWQEQVPVPKGMPALCCFMNFVHIRLTEEMVFHGGCMPDINGMLSNKWKRVFALDLARLLICRAQIHWVLDVRDNGSGR